MTISADLLQRLRARAATVSANGARETGELLLEAAEALEQSVAERDNADAQTVYWQLAANEIEQEYIAKSQEPERWFGNNIRQAWRTLRSAYQSRKASATNGRGWPPIPDPLPDPPSPPPPRS